MIDEHKHWMEMGLDWDELKYMAIGQVSGLLMLYFNDESFHIDDVIADFNATAAFMMKIKSGEAESFKRIKANLG